MKLLLKRCRQHFCTENLYKVLKTHPTCTAKEVRKAYFALSLKYHPDKVSEHEKKIATEKFKVIKQVYSIINDKEKRKAYDATVASRQLRKKPSSSQPRPTDEPENISMYQQMQNYRSACMEQSRIPLLKEIGYLEQLMRRIGIYVASRPHLAESDRIKERFKSFEELMRRKEEILRYHDNKWEQIMDVAKMNDRFMEDPEFFIDDLTVKHNP